MCKQHKYREKISKLLTDGTLTPKKGRVCVMAVIHDKKCGLYKGRHCDCDPDLKMVEVDK